jgi:hypothetical protein
MAEFELKCRGRNLEKKEALEEAVEVKVEIYQLGDELCSVVSCEYNCGPHGEKCKAAGEKWSYCCYSFDLPYALDMFFK